MTALRLSARETADLLIAEGIPALVEMTGGGCHTVYFGENIADYYAGAIGPFCDADTVADFAAEDIVIGRDGDEFTELIPDRETLLREARSLVTYQKDQAEAVSS